jgi:purine nucleosidase
MKQVWLDTDPGFDDWMAWALLEADPGVALHGVSVVAGNAPLASTLDNALRIAALHEWKTPIWAGAARPLAPQQVTAEDVLGAGGLRTTARVLPSARAPLQPGDAVDALIACVRAHPRAISLLAIGPLTNVALAFQRAPELPRLLGALVIMGGSQGAGNVTPVAEFNIYADPEAAAQVFAAHSKVAMFGIEVCRDLQVHMGHVQALHALGNEAASVFADHLDGYLEFGRRRGRSSTTMYDPTAVAWMAHPEWFTCKPAFVDVELRGTLTRGMTVCEQRVPERAAANALIGLRAEGDQCLAWAMDLLTTAWRAA